MGRGFRLDTIDGRTVRVNGVATAFVSFRAQASPVVRETVWIIKCNDAVAGTETGHSKLVRLRATISVPTLHLISINCIASAASPFDEIRGITGFGSLSGELTDVRQVLVRTRILPGQSVTIDQRITFTDEIFVGFFQAPFKGEWSGPRQVSALLRGAGRTLSIRKL